jgi:MbtH protein
MINTLEYDDIDSYALINDKAQYSLWPAFAAVPEGWTITHGKASRQSCLEHIENMPRIPRKLDPTGARNPIDSMNACDA